MIGATLRIGREIQCILYTGIKKKYKNKMAQKKQSVTIKHYLHLPHSLMYFHESCHGPVKKFPQVRDYASSGEVILVLVTLLKAKPSSFDLHRIRCTLYYYYYYLFFFYEKLILKIIITCSSYIQFIGTLLDLLFKLLHFLACSESTFGAGNKMLSFQ